ncbi:MAG: hypothetical protein ACI4MS_03670 [Candidatus Coproplasma sp.]
MRKRFTKIICASVAVISAMALAFAPGCANGWKGVEGAKDSAVKAVEGTNGGFLTETEDYVYFINGKANNTDSNQFGSVLKGSVQRLAKTDLANHNYTNTQTVVPSVIYAGSYNAGLYVYGGYLYYTTPSTQKNTDGEVLNSKLDFKRTKLDGTGTSDGYIWQSEDKAIDYRYVEVGDTVYIIYTTTESLYGSEKTNIHSVNCNTGANTLLAYGVEDYAFDTEDAENPYIYYTMKVPEAMGSSSTLGYNQLYRVRADVTESPREYDFSDVKDYDASKDPVYVNLGDLVFDGIGIMRAGTKLSQFNYGYDAENPDKTLELTNSDYTYDISWYKDGYLYYTRTEGSDATYLYRLNNSDVDANNDGKVDASWNAISANDDAILFVSENYSTEYTYVTMGGTLYAVETNANGIFKKPMEFNDATNSYSFGDSIQMSDDQSAKVLDVREEGGHTYLYYSLTGGNGYTIYRLAIDGTNDKYNMLPIEEELAYRSIQVLDLDACSDWYLPEFVGNTLFFASETTGMTESNYVMACDLTGADGIMSNAEIKAMNERYNAVMEKIEAYDSVTNSDGSKTYENLSGALKYQFYTRDFDYLGELIQAYIDMEGRDREYLYSDASVKIASDFATLSGDWEKDDDDNAYLTKTVNGEEVHSNTRDYYYTLVGRMTEADKAEYYQDFKDNTTYLKPYPVEDPTWWESLSTSAKTWFIIGMICAGLLVVAVTTLVACLIVKRNEKRKEQGETSSKMKVDITDDKNIDVYGDGKKDKEEGEEKDGE